MRLGVVGATIVSTGMLWNVAVGSQTELKVYYCIYGRVKGKDECIESGDAVAIDAKDIPALARRVFDGRDGNFIGFTDANGDTLQFYMDSPDEIFIDAPVPEHKGSYAKIVARRHALEIIDEISGPLKRYPEELHLRFQSWSPKDIVEQD